MDFTATCRIKLNFDMVRLSKFAEFKVQMTFLTCITQLSTGSARRSVVGTEGLRSPTEFQVQHDLI